MKKLTLTAVATVLLLASLTGYAQVAAFAPAPPTPAPALPTAAVPLTTEQTALVVEPAQMRQLNLWLDTGDRAEGRVTVVPEGINFIIEGPDGQLVLNVGLVTDKSFAFVAATSGLYRLVFANTLALVSNKVVTVQVQHPGPGQFPYFAGTYVPVSPLEYKTLAVPLAANQQLEGSFQIQGGPWDLAFSVIGPSGNTMIPSVKVYGSHTFTFTAGTGGAYELRFDNSLCAYTSKLVSLRCPPPPAARGNGGGQLPSCPSPPRRPVLPPGQYSPPSR